MAAVIAHDGPVYGHIADATHDPVTESIVGISQQGQETAARPVVVAFVLAAKYRYALSTVFLLEFDQLQTDLAHCLVPIDPSPLAFASIAGSFQRVQQLLGPVQPFHGQADPLTCEATAEWMCLVPFNPDDLAIFDMDQDAAKTGAKGA